MDTFTWITPGFGLRNRDGNKTYVVQYKLHNQHRRMTLGSTDKLTRQQAAKLAKTILGKVAAGRDPQGEEKAKRTASVVGTFKAVADDFLAHQKERRRASTLEATRRYLLYAKALHGLKIDAITRSQIAAVLNAIAKDHGKVASDRARATLSAMFSWAIKEGFLGDNDPQNPVASTNTKSEIVERDRVLSDEEVRQIWHAAGDDDFGRIVKLLLLTACRRTEIASLRWEELDLKNFLLVISGDRTKNGRAFEVPLTDLMLKLIAPSNACSHPASGTGFVFGKRGTGFSGFSKAKRELDAKLTGVEPWRLHDLRRTAATRMADIGVEPHHIEAVLNHVSGHRAGVAGIYNRSAYADQKRAALEAWAARLAVITGKNVTDIGKHRKAKRA
jgi:integrase